MDIFSIEQKIRCNIQIANLIILTFIHLKTFCKTNFLIICICLKEDLFSIVIEDRAFCKNLANKS